jgi:hypothetical protein
MITVPLFDGYDPTTTVSTQQMPIYGRRLNHGPEQSIPYFLGKDKPVKHMLALCSILWQENQRKVSKKEENHVLSTHRQDMLHNVESLPKDASEHIVA